LIWPRVPLVSAQIYHELKLDAKVAPTGAAPHAQQMER